MSTPERQLESSEVLKSTETQPDLSATIAPVPTAPHTTAAYRPGQSQLTALIPAETFAGPILPSAKRGARTLSVAFAIFRMALVVTAIISLCRVFAQVEMKQWFETHLYAVSFLDRSYAEAKRAKNDLFDYCLGDSNAALIRASNRLREVHIRLDDIRSFMADDQEFASTANIDAAEAALSEDLEQPLQRAIADDKTLGAERARANLRKHLLLVVDNVSTPFYMMHRDQTIALSQGSIRFRGQLQENGIGPVLVLLGTYLLLLAGLTRAYINQRRRNEQALQISESHIKLLLDNMYDGLLISDCEGRIETANERAINMLGYKNPAGITGKYLSAVVDRQLSEVASCVLSTSYSVVREGLATKANGTTLPAEYSVRAIETPSGQRILITLRDITEKKQAEQWKRDMVAVVSHDLRTPLTAIQASLELVQINALGEVPASVRPAVSKARTSAHTLINVINTLLDLEKLESLEEPQNLEPVDLHGTIDDALQRVFLRFDESNTPEICCADNSYWVLGDRLRLSQLFEQLISNAIKFSPADSTITIDVAMEGPWLQVRVNDQGRGIPKEYQELVFQRLQQVLPADREGGAGLGLTLCKAIVNLHGGAIGVDSTPGSGSSFWVLLRPLNSSDLQAISTQARPALMGA